MHQAECETPRQQGTRGVFISGDVCTPAYLCALCHPPCHAVRKRVPLVRSTANSNALVMLCVNCRVSLEHPAL